MELQGTEINTMIKLPSIPKPGIPSIPKPEIPSIPKPEIPSIPKPPKIPNPIPGIKDKITDIGGKIADVGKNVGQGVVNIGKKVGQAFVTFGKAFWKIFSGVFIWIWNMLKMLFGNWKIILCLILTCIVCFLLAPILMPILGISKIFGR